MRLALGFWVCPGSGSVDLFRGKRGQGWSSCQNLRADSKKHFPSILLLPSSLSFSTFQSLRSLFRKSSGSLQLQGRTRQPPPPTHSPPPLLNCCAGHVGTDDRHHSSHSTASSEVKSTQFRIHRWTLRCPAQRCFPKLRMFDKF